MRQTRVLRAMTSQLRQTGGGIFLPAVDGTADSVFSTPTTAVSAGDVTRTCPINRGPMFLSFIYCGLGAYQMIALVAPKSDAWTLGNKRCGMVRLGADSATGTTGMGEAVLGEIAVRC